MEGGYTILHGDLPRPNHSQSDFGAAAPVQQDHLSQPFNGATQPLPRERPISKYNDVRVLLLQWEDDDLNVAQEIEKLETLLRTSFNFFTRRWSIPSSGEDADSEELLSRQCYRFRREATKDDLLILYYGGHADSDSARCTWAANQNANSPTLNWHNVESILLGHDADVLLILDCCYATLAARNHPIGDNWLFAASTREYTAAGAGWNSFTSALTRELERAADRYWRMGETTSIGLLDHYMVAWSRGDLISTPKLTCLSEHVCPPTEITPLYPRSRPRLQSVKTEPSPQPKLEPSSPPIVPRPRPTATLPPINQIKAHARQGSPTPAVPFELSTDETQTLRIDNLPSNISEPQILQWLESGLEMSSAVSKIGPLCWNSSSSSMSTVITFAKVSFANKARLLRHRAFPQVQFDHIFKGLTTIYDSTPNHPIMSTIDIVLAHGAHGHAINSFACHYSNPSKEVLWPRDSLAEKLEVAGIFPRIMTYGWDPLDWLNSRHDVSRTIEDLAKALGIMRAGAPKRRLILIGHGIGGFLIKQYVTEVINNSLIQDDDNFENPFLACFFLAVPQPSSSIDTEFAKCLASMDSVLQGGRTPRIEYVENLQSRVRDIHNLSQEFNMISKGWKVGHFSFRELLDTSGHRVVPENLLNSQTDHQETPIWVNADHKGIASLKDSEASSVVVATIRNIICYEFRRNAVPDYFKSREADKEKVFAKLEEYDTRFLVDDSSSMRGPKWTMTKHVMAKIATIAIGYDKDGVDLRFFNKTGWYENLDTTERIMNIFNNYRPDGKTLTADKLELELKKYIGDYKENNSIKGLNLIVLTDGEPQPGQNVEAVIVNYARELAKLQAPLLQVGVQFVQIGDDSAAARFLQHLDNDIKGAYGLDRDVSWIIIPL